MIKLITFLAFLASVITLKMGRIMPSYLNRAVVFSSHKFDINTLECFRNWVGCISRKEASDLLRQEDLCNQFNPGKILSFQASIDMGYSSIDLGANDGGVGLPLKDNNELKLNLIITWEELKEIIERKNACHALYDDGSKPWQIQTISKSSGKPACLYPSLSNLSKDVKNV